VVRTPVGDKHVIDEMLRNGFNLGGEQSGHMIFPGFQHDRRWIGCRVAGSTHHESSRRTALESLPTCWTRFPQLITNIMVREKRPFDEMDQVPKLISEAEGELTPNGGRVLLAIFGNRTQGPVAPGGSATPLSSSVGRKRFLKAVKRQVGA
jgi:phosphoglucosamine mutase